MGWYLRKSVRVGPLRLNFSKRGLGMSTGVKGFRIGTGPRGPYVAGGRGGLYFRQSLARGGRRRQRPARTAPPVTTHAYAGTRAAVPNSQGMPAAPGMSAPASRHVYRGSSLIAMWVAYVFAVVLILSDPGTYTSGSQLGFTGSLGVLICLGVVVFVCSADWRGATSLNGFIQWRRLNGWQRFIVGCLLLGLNPFALAVYLAQASQAYRAARATEPLERKRQVARLEADLGIMPATSGACRTCGKPMQVGADFCAYCGAAAIEKPRICPNCATTTLPDATFCPTCRTLLPAR